MSFADSIVNKILELNIIEMVVLADRIVSTCNGPNCNFSIVTKTKIKAELEVLAQLQFAINARRLQLNPKSEAGTNILNSYIDLASVIGNTYVYHCGSQVEGSLVCVLSSEDVQNSRDALAELLYPVSEARVQHTLLLAVLAILIIIFSLMFVIYFVVAILASFTKKNYMVEK